MEQWVKMNAMHEADRKGWDEASPGWPAMVERNVDWTRLEGGGTSVLRLEGRFRERGVRSLARADVTTSGIRRPEPVPVPITGKSGDLVLAHDEPTRTASPNLPSGTWYMCLPRLAVRGLAGHRVGSMREVRRDRTSFRRPRPPG